jgi:cytochrome c-type protein NapC
MLSMTKKLLLLISLGGAIVGAAIVVGFNATLSYTNTDEFCLSCHNHDIPYAELKETKHWKNSAGVVAGCSDCHVPHEFLPKMMRKIAAAKEVYGHVTGVIDTDEKYLAHRDAMKTSEIARLKANDSAECRNCHQAGHMAFDDQSAMARKQHKKLASGSTCIDCHQGVAHSPRVKEDDFDF